MRFQRIDGPALAGWWMPGDSSSRAVVLAPGIEGAKSDRYVVEAAAVYAGAVVDESAYADRPLVRRQQLPEASGLPRRGAMEIEGYRHVGAYG